MTKRWIVSLLAALAVVVAGTSVALAGNGDGEPGPSVDEPEAGETRPASSFEEGELPERPERMDSPAPDDVIRVGAGDNVIEMTADEARLEAEKLAQEYAERDDGITPLWGVRSDGTTGAIAHCEATAPSELNGEQGTLYDQTVSRLPEDVDPEAATTVLVCSPAPGHEWPESDGPDWDAEIPLSALDN